MIQEILEHLSAGEDYILKVPLEFFRDDQNRTVEEIIPLLPYTPEAGTKVKYIADKYYAGITKAVRQDEPVMMMIKTIVMTGKLRDGTSMLIGMMQALSRAMFRSDTVKGIVILSIDSALMDYDECRDIAEYISNEMKKLPNIDFSWSY